MMRAGGRVGDYMIWYDLSPLGPKRKGRESEPPRAESPADFDKIPRVDKTLTSHVDKVPISQELPPPRRTRQSSRHEESTNEPTPSTTEVKSPNGPKKDSTAFSALEPTYCYCNQVSFGEMIGCDNPDCDIEWFHYACVGLSAPPPGKWFCPDCTAREAKSLSTAPRRTRNGSQSAQE